MKRYLIIAVIGTLTLSSLFTSSCKKELTKKPYDSPSESIAYNTPADFTNAARGMYRLMIQTSGGFSNNYLGGQDDFSWISSFDVLTDNVIIASTGRLSQLNFYQWTYSGNSAPNTWENGYGVIRLANGILANIDKLADDGSDFKNNIKGEALAVRAMVHFDLLRMYCKPASGPTAEPNGLGIPYITSVDLDSNRNVNRGTVQESYNRIVADMAAAESLIGNNNDIDRLSEPAVSGLLSRIYLYGGEWQKANDAANRSLAANSDVGSISTFPGIWTDDNNDGVLFKLVINNIDNVIVGVGFNQPGPGGQLRNEYVPDFDFFQSFSNDDIRKSTYFATTTFQSFEYNSIIKYEGKTGANANVNDVKYLRVAEVLLNRMESEYRLGNEADALTDFNALRAERYASFTPGTESGQALLDAILTERRKELCYEGDRFFDLKRQGKGVVRSENGDRADGTGVDQSMFLTLPAGDPRFQLHIPQYEITANKNIQQNPGY